MRYRRSRRHNLRKVSDEVLRMRAVFHIQQIGVSVQVVKVLQQRKIECVFDVLIGFAHCKHRGKFHGKLLVAYRRFKHGFVLWLEARAYFLLRLLVFSYESKLSAQIVVGAMTEKLMREPHRFVFRPVCEYATQLGKRMHVVLGITLRIHIFPVYKQFVDIFGFLFKRIESHINLLLLFLGNYFPLAAFLNSISHYKASKHMT